MMTWLRDAPIRQKLTAFGLITAACALIVATLVFVVTTYVVARRFTRNNVVAQATITADNIGAALAFGDQAAANDTLRALRAVPSIDVACAWNTAGGFFAAYQPRQDVACPSAPARALDRGSFDRLEVARAVTVAGRRVGWLYIRANLDEVTARMQIQAIAAAAALLLGALVAIAFALAFQRVIARPLIALAGAAHDISKRGDYSVRVSSEVGRDELGDVVTAFNGMLEQIERRDDELRNMNRLKDEFLATVSHELRTPLNAILGWLQILQMTPASQDRLQQALQSLDRNARTQARLVEDLLDVSRIVAGKLRLKLGVIDATQVVEAAVDVVRPTADAKEVRLESNIGSPPHLVKGDPDRLQQAVWNLLANAVKFTDPGGRITISIGHTPAEAWIVVEDTGIGIDAHFLPHVFAPFRQADATTTRKHPGLGLGLAIVREITLAHGGQIDAFSAGYGHGSRFVLRLPTAHGQAITRPPVEKASGADRALKGISIVVVDDDPDGRDLAAIALAERGAYVAAAADAVSALELISTRDVDVVVADLAMPNVDGYGLLDRIRSNDVATGRRLPVIALTAHASADEELRALAAGFYAYLRKPYRFDDLVNAILAAVRAARIAHTREQDHASTVRKS